ncbi:L,D-transpeptidase [Polaribacter sp. Z014]|uniref:L,D-transpeptidase n=1 Tax=Polaribacter sp. Z014 TaxID=2927126 RepID=UPI002022451C|nr:L,D-transpeptidase [Polaribacter sp. Z014]MCL7762103.1 L,D-transpeptidase [Polaribacter sp. Z014]
MKHKINFQILLLLLIYFHIGNINAVPFLQIRASFSNNIAPKKITIKKNITVENYFQFIDSLVIKYDTLTTYKLTEHLLVRANPWIINTLKNTDYYLMKVKDSFVYNQKKMVVLKKGNQLIIPDSIKAKEIYNSFTNTRIDINIPEYKLRIFENDKELYSFPVRVGRNEKKYLKMAGRILDLRTKTGKGKIVGYERFPDFYNPANGHRYYVTNRDDKKVTKLPQIPFIETEINGLRYGQLIHTTTNPKTLGKAYSNGCIGAKEADVWVIYYYTPINTKITIRYNLNIKDSISGKNIILKDIYGYSKK